MPPFDFNYVLLGLYLGNFIYAFYTAREWERAYFEDRQPSLFSRCHLLRPLLKAWPERTRWVGLGTTLYLPRDDFKSIMWMVCVFPPAIAIVLLSTVIFAARFASQCARRCAARVMAWTRLRREKSARPCL